MVEQVFAVIQHQQGAQRAQRQEKLSFTFCLAVDCQGDDCPGGVDGSGPAQGAKVDPIPQPDALSLSQKMACCDGQFGFANPGAAAQGDQPFLEHQGNQRLHILIASNEGVSRRSQVMRRQGRGHILPGAGHQILENCGIMSPGFRQKQETVCIQSCVTRHGFHRSPPDLKGLADGLSQQQRQVKLAGELDRSFIIHGCIEPDGNDMGNACRGKGIPCDAGMTGADKNKLYLACAVCREQALQQVAVQPVRSSVSILKIKEIRASMSAVMQRLAAQAGQRAQVIGSGCFHPHAHRFPGLRKAILKKLAFFVEVQPSDRVIFSLSVGVDQRR